MIVEPAAVDENQRIGGGECAEASEVERWFAAPFTPPNSDVSCTPGTCAMISCTVWAGECAISSAVMTVVVAPARMFGVTVVAGAAGAVAGCGAVAGWRTRGCGVMRRQPRGPFG